MSEKTQPNEWKSDEIKQVRRFLLNWFLRLFVAGDTPEEREIELRKLCRDPRDPNGTIASYDEREGALPLFITLQKWEKGVPGIAHCGWHSVCSLAAGKKPPSDSQLAEFEKKNLQLLKQSRLALQSRSAASSKEQREFILAVESLDSLADALLNFRRAQQSWNADEIARAGFLVQYAWKDAQSLLPDEIVKPLSKLISETFGACGVKKTDPVLQRSFAQRIRISLGFSDECRFGFREAVSNRSDSSFLRAALFATGLISLRDKTWRVKRSISLQCIGWIYISHLILVLGFCLLALDLQFASGLHAIAQQFLAWCSVIFSLAFTYYLFVWPSKQVAALQSESA